MCGCLIGIVILIFILWAAFSAIVYAVGIAIVLAAVIVILFIKSVLDYQKVKNIAPSEMKCPNCGSEDVKISQVQSGVTSQITGSQTTTNINYKQVLICDKCNYSWDYLSALDVKKMKNNAKNRVIGFGVAIGICIILILWASSNNKNEDSDNRTEHVIYETQDETSNTSSESDENITETLTQSPMETHTSISEPTSDVEITFRDIPWGSSYTDVNKILDSFDLMANAGQGIRNPSVDAILYDDDNKGIEFENNYINIIASALNTDNADVAGYELSEMNLYFAYAVTNGVINRTEENSKLYGAKYYLNPSDITSANNDLVSKLSSIYGNPAKSETDIDYDGDYITYTYWYGINDTELILKTIEASEENRTDYYTGAIVISYAWREGDDLMQQASDAISAEAIANEEITYENNSLEGL